MNGAWPQHTSTAYTQSSNLTAENLQGSAYSALPKEPGAYEDFSYSAPFDFPDLFDTTPTARTPLTLSPTSYNPFDPAHLGFEPFPPPMQASTSTSHLPPMPLPSGAPPAPLLDEGESALFSSFLAGVGGQDSGFLFDPKLPPGMPSPPSELWRGTETSEERREGDRLGESVGGLSLVGAGAGAWHAIQHHTGREGTSAGVGFAQPPASQVIKSEFDNSPPTASYLYDHEARETHPSASASTSRTRGTTRTQEEQATGGRGHKLHKSTHAEQPETLEDEGDAMMREHDADAEDGASSTRRRMARSAASSTSRRRHSSNARTAPQPPSFAPLTTSNTSPVPPVASSMVRPRSNSSSSAGGGGVGGTSQGGGGGEKRGPLTESEKRQNHILSEQRRRNQIKVGFASLVDLLSAGEEASGISIKPPPEEGGAEKGKKKGRGRGRKGEIGSGASKSVVLGRAARYVGWLERGNEAIEEEIRRVEGLLGRI